MSYTPTFRQLCLNCHFTTYSFDCSFPSFISPLLNFSGYCII